jgi:hypothetical protein
VSEQIYGDNTCYEDYGFVENIKFTTTANRKKVIASGLVPVVEFYDCYTYELVNLSDSVVFTMNLVAITDEASSSSGTNHYKYGTTYQVNTHYDSTWRPALANASTIISDFGAIMPYWAELGQRKDHTVEIIK